MPDISTTSSDYDDDCSLFGSPPPSPSRGRSPSPLAFPCGTAQNVGTLALPGSHLVAELPVTPPALSSLIASAAAPSSQPLSRPPSQPRPPLRPIGGSSRRNSAELTRAPRTESAARRSRKGKERTTSTTPRPTPPPIALPSPNETPPPNFLRNQQALLGVAGMVGGVNPANLSKTRYTRGTTAENPIVVEDEPTLAQQPSIGKRPIRPGPSDPSDLPRPTSEQILGTLLQQKNILPVVISLLRLLVPGAPSLASAPPSHPFYTYSHAPATASRSPRSQLPSFGAQTSAQTRSRSPEQTNSHHSHGFTAPPPKRRKLNSVPAGAGDWDVPYPFQEGQGPENYRSTWERERGKQLLADLVQLVRGAAQKAATKAWYEQQRILQSGYRRGGAGAWYGPFGSTKHYRPATFYYGLERPNARYHAPQVSPLASGAQCPAPEICTVASGAVPVQDSIPMVLPTEHVDPPPSTQSQPQMCVDTPPPDLSSVAFDQLVESLLAAQQQQQQHPSSSIPLGSMSDTTAGFESLSEGTQALFDNWLEMLTAFPPGDPNDASGSATAGSPMLATSSLANSVPGISATSLPAADPYLPSRISDAMIDPILLNLATTAMADTSSQPRTSTSTEAHAYPGLVADPSGSASSVTSTAVGLPPAHTPSLVASPSVTTTSLADSGDAGPATPSWDWAFPELGHVEGTKMLDELVGMDVDVPMPEWRDDTAAGTVLPRIEATGVSLAPPVVTGAAAEQTPVRPDPAMETCTREATHTAIDPTVASQTPGDTASFDVDASLALSSTPQTSSGPTPSCAASASVDTPPPPHPALYSHTSSLPPDQMAQLVPRPSVAPLLPKPSARAKGKAKAVPGPGCDVGVGIASAGAGKLDRRAVVERARAMRAALVKEVERAKVALWETTLEQGVLVGLGRELEKEGGGR